MAKCRQLGRKPQGAIFFGGDPIFGYACQVQVSDDTNDWHVAGGLRGAPVELVKCKTVDLEVPAWAEVVVEFEVELDGVVQEGPLGEYTGYYTPPPTNRLPSSPRSHTGAIRFSKGCSPESP